jgi:hypothetical protein
MGDEENYKYKVVERLPLIMFSVLMIIQLKLGFSPDPQQKRRFVRSRNQPLHTADC